jgi:hypothetical protein
LPQKTETFEFRRFFWSSDTTLGETNWPLNYHTSFGRMERDDLFQFIVQGFIPSVQPEQKSFESLPVDQPHLVGSALRKWNTKKQPRDQRSSDN